MLEQDSQKDLAKLKVQLHDAYGQGLNITTKSLLGNVSWACQSAIKSEEADLIVLGTKGASGVKEMLIGSNASEVIRNVAAPVLAIPEEASLALPWELIFARKFFRINKLIFAKLRTFDHFPTVF